MRKPESLSRQVVYREFFRRALAGLQIFAGPGGERRRKRRWIARDKARRDLREFRRAAPEKI